MKTSRATVTRNGCHPAPKLQHLGLGVFIDRLLTSSAEVTHRVRLALLPNQTLKLQALLMPAVRARHHEVALVRLLKLPLDARSTGDGRGRHNQYLAPGKRAGSCLGQRDGITLTFYVTGVTVHLIQEEVTHRHGAQAHRTVGPCEDQHPTSELLGKDSIARVTRTRRCDEGRECFALFNQRVNALLGVSLGHLHRGSHGHHGTGCHVDHIANPVVTALGATNLSAFHEHHALHG